MEWISDPTIWAGLLTLIVLEIVLGIDNLVFIAILADKLPSKLRNKARITGLTCALFMRVILLFSLNMLISLNNPIINLWSHQFSARDILMLCGGLFLFFKATMELNERLEGKDKQSSKQRKTAKFWAVVAQIIMLDAIFSLDSVITAFGMVEHISIMITAVIITMILMIIASRILTTFVNTHQTIVILCLSFLLMIGFSLVSEGFGYLIPKGYIYAVIGFSIMIESLNQFASFNQRRFLKGDKSLRQRTAEAVLRVLDGQHENTELDYCTADLPSESSHTFKPQERQMIVRFLGFTQRNVSGIMTSRYDIKHIDINKPADILLNLLEKIPNAHHFIVTNELISNEPVGVIHVIDVLNQQLKNKKLNLITLVTQPLIFHEGLSLLQALEQFCKTHTHFAFVVDECGSVEGVVTLTNIMETITGGNIPISEKEVDSRHDIQQLKDNRWITNGFIPLEDLILYVPITLDKKREYETIAGLLIERLQRVPVVGERIKIENWIFEPLEVTSHRLKKILITPMR